MSSPRSGSLENVSDMNFRELLEYAKANGVSQRDANLCCDRHELLELIENATESEAQEAEPEVLRHGPSLWDKPSVRVVLLGTCDPGSVLFALNRRHSLLEYIFSFWGAGILIIGGTAKEGEGKWKKVSKLSSLEMYDPHSLKGVKVDSVMSYPRMCAVAVVYGGGVARSSQMLLADTLLCRFVRLWWHAPNTRDCKSN